jgi:membrane protease YdiL (CAAX protease family)
VILKRIIAPLVPYLTVGIGFLVLHNVWVAVLSYHLGMIAVILLSGTRISLKSLFQRTNNKILPVLAAIGLCGGMLLYVLWPFLSIPDNIGYYLQNRGLTDQVWPFFITYLIIVNPFLEEFYWRGFLSNPSKGIIVNDFFFSGYHILVLGSNVAPVWSAVVFAVLTGAAWFWRQTNRISSNLLPSLACHLAADASILLVIYYMIRMQG